MSRYKKKTIAIFSSLVTTWLFIWFLLSLLANNSADASDISYSQLAPQINSTGVPTPTQFLFLPVLHHDYTAPTWTRLGITNTEITTLIIDPNKPETLYAGTYKNGAWRSQDGGQTWTIMAGLPITRHVLHIAAAPVSPTVLYAMGDDGFNLYRSVNSGDTWQMLTQPSFYRPSTLAVNPTTPTIVYAGISILDTTVGGHVVRSDDGGMSWEQILPYYTMANDIVVNPQNPQEVYVGRSFKGGMLKSNDNGDTWQEINNGLSGNALTIYQILLHPDNAQKIYILTGDGIYYSLNGGGSWSDDIDSGLPVESIASTLALMENRPETLFIAPRQGSTFYGIYRSDNGGSSWRWFISNPFTNLIARKIVVGSGDPTILFVHFVNSGGGDGQIWKLGPL